MAHMLEQANDMMYVDPTGNNAPWHHLGTRLIEAPNTEQALKTSHMDWQVNMRPLFNEFGDQSTHRETFRADNGKVLGVVGPNYVPLQNTEAFSFFDPLIQDGTLQYETAGILQGGKKVWILARTASKETEVAKDDVVRNYVLLSNSHDGTMAIRVGFVGIRVVCWNTLSMAIESEDSKLIRIRHTTNSARVIEEIRKIMVVSESAFQTTIKNYKKLTKCQVSLADIKQYVTVVFGLKEESERKREPESLTKIIDLFEHGRGNDLPSIKGSAWALYNASAEYAQYFQGRTEESRLNNIWFGQGFSRNKVALQTALELVEKKAA